MTIRYDTTDAQHMIFTVYSFIFLVKFLIYKYIPIREIISTSQCSQLLIDMQA